MMLPSGPPRRELVERLWHDPRARSRNRNFFRFRDDPVYCRAVRAVRFLHALRADLLRFRASVEVTVAPDADPGTARITLVVPPLRYRRAVSVSAVELELLRADPSVGDLLASHSGEGSESRKKSVIVRQ
jgi:hypothetical protein